MRTPQEARHSDAENKLLATKIKGLRHKPARIPGKQLARANLVVLTFAAFHFYDVILTFLCAFAEFGGLITHAFVHS